jgi:LysR family hydrogen peroxide-inducible transcriptional activator
MNGGLYPHVYKVWLFSRVAVHKSFKRAAADASITLSALSQSITALERVLGKTLLVRTRAAKLALTEDGEDLLARATPILAAIAELGDPNDGSGATRRAKLRLGLYETIAANHLPHLLPKLQRDFPHLTIHVWTARSAALERHLRNGDLDAVVVVRDPGIREENAEVLAKGELGFFVSPPEKETSWEVLESKGLAMFAPNYDGYPAYQRKFLDSHEAFFREAGIKWRIGMTSDSLETIRRVVAIGLLAAVLPVRAARRSPREVVMLKAPPQFHLDRGVHEHCLVTRDSLDPVLRRFLRRELTNLLSTVD